MIAGVTCECPDCGNTELRRNQRTGKLECRRCQPSPLERSLAYDTFVRQLCCAIDWYACFRRLAMSEDEQVWFYSDWDGEHRSIEQRIADLVASRRVSA